MPSSPLSPRRRFGVLLLKLGALAAAGGAQAIVATRPGLSVAGFTLSILLFVVAERTLPAGPERQGRSAQPVPLLVWWLLGTGCLICCAAGVLVHRNAAPGTTHPLWVAGLLLLITGSVWSWWSGGWQRPARRLVGALLVLCVVAGGMFGWHVSTVPPEVHNDEAEIGNDAVALLETKPFNLFTTGWYELPMFHALPAAIGVKLFGVNMLGLRSPSVVLGVASVLLLFALAYPVWGFETAFVAALLLASTRFFIHLSRTGYHYIDTPFVSVVVVWLLLQVWQDLGVGAAVWCGIALGLGMQTYYASRLVPVLLTLTWLLWLLGSDRTLLRARVGRFVVVAIVALVTTAPMIGYFWNHWDALWARTRGTSVFTEGSYLHLSYGYGTKDFGRILLIQAEKALTLFNVTPDTSLQYGYRAGALFDPVSAVLFVLGLGVVCARPLRRLNLMLLLWVVIPVVVGAALTIDTPFFPRISGVVPFAVLIVALALHSVLDSIRDAIPGSAGRRIAAIVATAILAAVFMNNLRTYFIEYAPHHRHSAAVEISAWIRAHGAGKTTYMVGGAPGFFIKHATIRFLTRGYETADIVDLDAYLQQHRLDPATSLFIIMPQGHDAVPKLVDAVGPLDLSEHRNVRNEIDFYAGIPRAGWRDG
jgi:hypothetical protein